jgi:6-pyruvoyltetrahydropterin/6-carboxytetrahydropterin synthase
MPFQSTKRYGHELGFSCCFRQWKAQSHCRLLHGYALSFKFVFEAEELDYCGWCVDFGSMKGLKGWLENTFDHTLVVSADDPELTVFKLLHQKGIANVVVLDACGCEMFAQLVHECTVIWLKDNGYSPRVRLVSTEVAEHGSNSAIYLG